MFQAATISGSESCCDRENMDLMSSDLGKIHMQINCNPAKMTPAPLGMAINKSPINEPYTVHITPLIKHDKLNLHEKEIEFLVEITRYKVERGDI